MGSDPAVPTEKMQFRGVWAGVAVFLFVLSVGLILADSGDRTNWYMWAALAGAAVAGVAGSILLVRARRVWRVASR